MSKYYKDHYDVIIIGAALAGLSSALTLLKKGYDVLVLEQHNLPGGVATSFVRGDVELEASLHEMVSVGPVEHPLKLRKYFKQFDIDVDWVSVSDAYRLVTPDIDIVLRHGDKGDFTKPCEDIAKACGDKDGTIFNNLMKFFAYCLENHDSADAVSGNYIGKLEIAKNHLNFIKGFGYTFLDVAKAFNLPDKAIDILSAYWMYLGAPLNDMPFTMYGYILADYIGYGAYIPRHTSHEISLKMLEKVIEMGGQVEFNSRVENILVKNKKVYGVTTDKGESINCDYVISGAYPNTVYSKMISPLSEVSDLAKKTINSMELGVSCFSIVLLLDKSHEELGLNDYATFYALNDMDTVKIFESGTKLEKWVYLTSICTNVAISDASPKGTTIYSITYLPDPSSFKDVDVINYQQYKDLIVEHFLNEESKRLGFNLKDHILEIVVETPISISHYVGSYKGVIYGYRHSMNAHSAAREMMNENFIEGLAFAGSHSTGGDGMAPAISNGHIAAKQIIDLDNKRRKKQ